MNEDHVAFHDRVTLLGWSDSSSQGPKVKFALADRKALEHFDTATRRRKKKAGQRYYASLLTINATPQVTATMEFWFAGANWAHQEGARVAFAVTADDLDVFKTWDSADRDKDHATIAWLTLVQIDDNEQPVDQRRAANVETVIGVDGTTVAVRQGPDVVILDEASSVPESAWNALEPTKLKGGPRSKNVAMLCQDDEFRYYVAEVEGFDDKATVEQADAMVKRLSGIQSKVEFDHNDSAWERFIAEVRRPFFEFMGGAK